MVSYQILHQAIYDILLLSKQYSSNHVINGFAFLEIMCIKQVEYLMMLHVHWMCLACKTSVMLWACSNVIIRLHTQNKSSGILFNFSIFVGTCPFVDAIFCALPYPWFHPWYYTNIGPTLKPWYLNEWFVLFGYFQCCECKGNIWPVEILLMQPKAWSGSEYSIYQFTRQDILKFKDMKSCKAYIL